MAERSQISGMADEYKVHSLALNFFLFRDLPFIAFNSVLEAQKENLDQILCPRISVYPTFGSKSFLVW